MFPDSQRETNNNNKNGENNWKHVRKKTKELEKKAEDWQRSVMNGNGKTLFLMFFFLRTFYLCRKCIRRTVFLGFFSFFLFKFNS